APVHHVFAFGVDPAGLGLDHSRGLLHGRVVQELTGPFEQLLVSFPAGSGTQDKPDRHPAEKHQLAAHDGSFRSLVPPGLVARMTFITDVMVVTLRPTQDIRTTPSVRANRPDLLDSLPHCRLPGRR